MRGGQHRACRPLGVLMLGVLPLCGGQYNSSEPLCRTPQECGRIASPVSCGAEGVKLARDEVATVCLGFQAANASSAEGSKALFRVTVDKFAELKVDTRTLFAFARAGACMVMQQKVCPAYACQIECNHSENDDGCRVDIRKGAIQYVVGRSKRPAHDRSTAWHRHAIWRMHCWVWRRPSVLRLDRALQTNCHARLPACVRSNGDRASRPRACQQNRLGQQLQFVPKYSWRFAVRLGWNKHLMCRWTLP